MLWIVWNPPFLLITSQLQLSATGPWLNASESDGWMPVFSSTPKKTAQVFGRSDAVQWFCKKKKNNLIAHFLNVFFVGWTPQNSRCFNWSLSFWFISLLCRWWLVSHVRGFLQHDLMTILPVYWNQLRDDTLGIPASPCSETSCSNLGCPPKIHMSLKKRDHFERKSIVQPLVFRGDASFLEICVGIRCP